MTDSMMASWKSFSKPWHIQLSASQLVFQTSFSWNATFGLLYIVFYAKYILCPDTTTPPKKVCINIFGGEGWRVKGLKHFNDELREKQNPTYQLV